MDIYSHIAPVIFWFLLVFYSFRISQWIFSSDLFLEKIILTLFFMAIFNLTPFLILLFLMAILLNDGIDGFIKVFSW